ncbi:uncharacterized protein [Solanum tuberosum]|uniref:uncharacterized protein isoform X3 n=1 Tax=Solanum tuberosum TaxID=4113 RepID=UPI0003D26418|nr:PREDICTED: uncharacterized protein LOC102578377 isoform X3 [Solanum tuberosum]
MIRATFSSLINILFLIPFSIIDIKFCSDLGICFLSLLEWTDEFAFTLHLCYAEQPRVLTRLRRYGVAGVLSYGLLNTAYYLTTFLIVWFYVAPSPGRMGYLAAVERFLKVMAMVWAGSQVTKIVRAGGALALAPFVDTGLSWFTTKMKFESQGKAFAVVAGFCFGLAFMLFLIITLLWA